MPSLPPKSDPASEGWRIAKSLGAFAERVAVLPLDEASARAMLRAEAQRFGAARARITTPASCLFFDQARDAAAAFGDADAATPTFAPIAALIEGIRIVDDIQDEEAVCLATEVGVDRALTIAAGAMALALDLIADLPLRGPAWRATCASLGSGLRETAEGQELERSGTASIWEVIDRKTAPLVATALEVGALAAGADVTRAAALAQLAVPLGRLIQIGDDCHDALGPEAKDWRAPKHNLLLAYALSGPYGATIFALPPHEAKLALLRDGALAYAMHAFVTTLAEAATRIESLALPHREPFTKMLDAQREQAAALLLRSGVDAELAATLTASS